ncbi:reverse transcriptase domain-containing protein [Tanacetum coccineum]
MKGPKAGVGKEPSTKRGNGESGLLKRSHPFCRPVRVSVPALAKECRGHLPKVSGPIFEGQIGRNLEAYVDDMVIKSKTEPNLIKDIEETLLTLKKVNMKLNPIKCLFEMEEEDTFQTMRKLIAELPTLKAPMKDEETMVYLSAANEAVCVVLLVERNRRQMPICNSITSKREVITDKPINKILNSPEASERLARWAVDLGAYRITYAPRNTIKVQVLADFLADTMTRDDPNNEETAGPEKPSDQKKALKLSKSKEKQMDKADTWKSYTDGASNDYRFGAGLILIDPEGMEYSYALRLNFGNSNNNTEYEALLTGLRMTVGIKVEKMHTFVDSKLVANQVEGSFL